MQRPATLTRNRLNHLPHPSTARSGPAGSCPPAVSRASDVLPVRAPSCAPWWGERPPGLINSLTASSRTLVAHNVVPEVLDVLCGEGGARRRDGV